MTCAHFGGQLSSTAGRPQPHASASTSTTTDHTNDVKVDDGKRRRQVESGLRPVPTGWLSCHHVQLEERVAAPEHLATH